MRDTVIAIANPTVYPQKSIGLPYLIGEVVLVDARVQLLELIEHRMLRLEHHLLSAATQGDHNLVAFVQIQHGPFVQIEA